MFQIWNFINFYFGYNIKFFLLFLRFWYSIMPISFFILFFILKVYNIKAYYKIKNYKLSKNVEQKTVKKIYEKKGKKINLNLGIYLKNFIKNKEVLNKDSNFYYIIIRFVRKNLFLTLLDLDGDVLCKSNIGSSGFKKKVKWTGYAIKRTCKKFSKKLLKPFLTVFYITRVICKKKMENIKRKIKFNNIIKKKINIKRKKKYTKKKKFYLKKALLNKISFKESIRNALINIKLVNKYNNYRKYPYFPFLLKNNININVRIKSSLKFWGMRFVRSGLFRKFKWFKNIEVRLPIPHSNGLRLKKKRRL